MGEVPTKPGQGAPKVRNALDDTIRAEPSLQPTEGATATSSIPAAERYQLGAELGRGGMGRVVEAFDVQLGRTVALKEALPKGGPSVARRMVREVQLTARLEHPSIVPLYDAGTTVDGRPFYVMRRVTGRPLDQLMAQAAGLGERLTLVPAVLAAIDAVAHAHRRGVIHRDLKPANILVGELGETVVIDWGLAKVIGEDYDKPGTTIDPTGAAGRAVGVPTPRDPATPIAAASDSLRTQLGSVFGTPGFMAPEQARGEELDPRGDVYALGATLYQLLAGAPPHSGTSATEVIANTGSREVTPVDVVAPGAPPELVAIVGKALAFDPRDRYPDAGALGEDVRRFLAGQLVAAHRYTPRQRIARFARRQRAPLSVAALALVTLAVLAWIGVHRIVEERDAATEARELATRSRQAAEHARDELQRRADQLVVLQARGLVDSNPTHAAAVLKELPDTSQRLGDARAVAQAAIVRGVAWTMPSSDQLTVFAQLSLDARFLLQTTRDGMVRVVDLDHRRPVIARQYRNDARALWVGKAVLVTGPSASPELLDPFAGASRGLAVGPITWAVASDAGDRVAFLDGHDEAQVLEVGPGTALPLWPGHRVTAIQIAADGRWIALADAASVIVVDPTGRELTRHAGPAQRLFVSRFDELGVALRDSIAICKLSPRPTWTDIDLKPQAPALAIDFLFRGHELDIFVSTGKILAWNGSRLWERLRLDGLSFALQEAAGDLLVAPGNDGKLHVSNDLVTGSLHLPTPLTNLKVLARAGAPRVVALGRGLIVGFDLAASFPEQLHLPRNLVGGVFVDDDTLLMGQSVGGGWQWYDLRTRRSTPAPFEPRGITAILDVDPGDGRVLIRDTANDARLALLRKGAAAPLAIAHGPSVWGRLMPHNTVLFGGGNGRVIATIDGAPPHEVVKLDGIVDGAVAIGATRFAAVSSGGELVRGNLATGELVRARLQPGPTDVLAADHNGRVLLAQDTRLLLWDRDIVELARLDQRIIGIIPLDDGALLELADHSMLRTALVVGAAQKQVMAASAQSPLISADRRLAIGPSVNGQVVVVELATQATWDLPAYHAAFDLIAISPTARRFVASGFGQLALWTLPLAPPELGPWLDEHTNAATDADHALAWPWQLAQRP